MAKDQGSFPGRGKSADKIGDTSPVQQSPEDAALCCDASSSHSEEVFVVETTEEVGQQMDPAQVGKEEEQEKEASGTSASSSSPTLQSPTSQTVYARREAVKNTSSLDRLIQQFFAVIIEHPKIVLCVYTALNFMSIDLELHLHELRCETSVSFGVATLPLFVCSVNLVTLIMVLAAGAAFFCGVQTILATSILQQALGTLLPTSAPTLSKDDTSLQDFEDCQSPEARIPTEPMDPSSLQEDPDKSGFNSTQHQPEVPEPEAHPTMIPLQPAAVE